MHYSLCSKLICSKSKHCRCPLETNNRKAGILVCIMIILVSIVNIYLLGLEWFIFDHNNLRRKFSIFISDSSFSTLYFYNWNRVINWKASKARPYSEVVYLYGIFCHKAKSQCSKCLEKRWLEKFWLQTVNNDSIIRF